MGTKIGAILKLNFDKTSFKHYNFKWSDADEAYLVKFRDMYGLEKLALGCKDQYEILQKCVKWPRSRFDHSGANSAKKSDSISILNEAALGRKFRCVEYSIVLKGCLTALGIKSRVLGLCGTPQWNVTCDIGWCNRLINWYLNNNILRHAERDLYL